MTDGSREDGRCSLSLDETVHLTPERWEELQGVVQRRVLRYFRRHELLDARVTHDRPCWRSTRPPAFDPAEPEPVPEYVFDQSLPDKPGR